MSFLDKLKRDWKAKKPLVDEKELDTYIKEQLQADVDAGETLAWIYVDDCPLLECVGGTIGVELIGESLHRLGVKGRKMTTRYGYLASGWTS